MPRRPGSDRIVSKAAGTHTRESGGSCGEVAATGDRLWALLTGREAVVRDT